MLGGSENELSKFMHKYLLDIWKDFRAFWPNFSYIVNRPGVAGAVLQAPSLPTDLFSDYLLKYLQYTFPLKL